MLKRVTEDPFIPARWPVNKPGMQATEYLEGEAADSARERWLSARDSAVHVVNRMLSLGVHKQIANRLLEPFLWHTAIISSTRWSNFFAQRCHKDAQDEIRTIAEMMEFEHTLHEPEMLSAGEWHLPFVQEDERTSYPIDILQQLSIARCARVSYLAHEGKREHSKDHELFWKLRSGMHFSPFEHVAKALSIRRRSGNFTGFEQFRKSILGECR